MPNINGTLSTASPAGPEEGWFSPMGEFRIWRDGGSGTLALMERDGSKGGAGWDTGETLTAAGSKAGTAGQRGNTQFRLVLASGSGPVNWRASWD